MKNFLMSKKAAELICKKWSDDDVMITLNDVHFSSDINVEFFFY